MTDQHKTIVIALGGNALGDTSFEQLELVQNTAVHIVDLIASGHKVLVSHGNGPQVGMIYNAIALAAKKDDMPDMPFPECGAMSQGYIGYHLCQAIQGELNRRGIDKHAATVVSQTVVDKNDPAFQDPAKPIGPFMNEADAQRIAAKTGYVFKEDSGRGWRRVVSSPKPERIVELEAIQALANAGFVVVFGGGGGVPVVEDTGRYTGVPAVIDKDRSSAKLAADIQADMLVILTAVEKVCLNYNTPDQVELEKITVTDACEYIAQGHFAPGSMLPKIGACIEYLEAFPQGTALVTSLECAAAGLRGETGTAIVSQA